MKNGECIKFSLQATLSEIFKGLKPEGGKFYKNIYYVFINNPVWKYIREAKCCRGRKSIGVNFILGSFNLHLWDEISK